MKDFLAAATVSLGIILGCLLGGAGYLWCREHDRRIEAANRPVIKEIKPFLFSGNKEVDCLRLSYPSGPDVVYERK